MKQKVNIFYKSLIMSISLGFFICFCRWYLRCKRICLRMEFTISSGHFLQTLRIFSKIHLWVGWSNSRGIPLDLDLGRSFSMSSFELLEIWFRSFSVSSFELLEIWFRSFSFSINSLVSSEATGWLPRKHPYME